MNLLGLSFLITLFFSGIFGNTCVMLPLSYLIFPFSLKLYRWWTDLIAGFWFKFPIAFFEIVCGTKIFIVGDDFKRLKDDKAILISNHRTRLDWMFLWSLLFRAGSLSREKIVLKDDLKKIPGFGWAMQQFCFLFLSRKWEKDEKQMENVLNHLVAQDYPLQLLIFPEGSDLSPSNKIKSNEFAKKNNLQSYEYVLHPRVRGFHHTVSLLKGHVDAVYDITIGYLPIGLIPQNEKVLLTLELPKEIHFHVKRYSISEIPKDEAGLSDWCNKRWQDKEKLLEKFYKDKQFPGTTDQSLQTEGQMTLGLVAGAWINIILACLLMLFNFAWARWYLLVVCIIQVVVTKMGGAENLEMKYYNLSRGKETKKSK